MKKFIPLKKLSTTAVILLAVSFILYVVFQLHHIKDFIIPISTYAPDSPKTRANSTDDLSYGVVVDCGSSGSRVFVYYWEPHSGSPNHLLNIKILKNSSDEPVVSKIEPGISSFHKRPSEASDYISPLLEFAVKHIPTGKIKETPLYILATAGLRLLTQDEQTAILNDLKTDLSLDYDFILYNSHVEVISGKDEAIYAWTALNHVLGKFNHKLDDDPLIAVEVSGKMHIRKRTVGILDLGGASLQMALELPQTHSVIDPRIKEHVFEFNLGCSSTEFSHKYKVYARTFLGHGSNEVRMKYIKWLTGLRTNNSSTKHEAVVTLEDECLSYASKEKLIENGILYNFIGTGKLDVCKENLKVFLNKSIDCLLSDRRRCSIDGAVLPDINYRNVEFYGSSEFFYTMQDVLEIGGSYNYYHFLEHAKNYCSTLWSDIELWKNSSRFPRADAERYRLQCFKSAWVLITLHEGLNFPLSYRHFSSIQYVDGSEVHWSLGAIIHKTKYYPLRDIEKLSTSPRSRTALGPTNFLIIPPGPIIILSILFSALVISLCCVHLIYPLMNKKHRSTTICSDSNFEGRTDDFKTTMVRSRSYGILVP